MPVEWPENPDAATRWLQRTYEFDREHPLTYGDNPPVGEDKAISAARRRVRPRLKEGAMNERVRNGDMRAVRALVALEGAGDPDASRMAVQLRDLIGRDDQDGELLAKTYQAEAWCRTHGARELRRKQMAPAPAGQADQADQDDEGDEVAVAAEMIGLAQDFLDVADDPDDVEAMRRIVDLLVQLVASEASEPETDQADGSGGKAVAHVSDTPHPEPFSSSRTSNWVARGGGLPAYIQNIGHDLMEKRGLDESRAIQMAIGIVQRWARGGGNVSAATRAKAAAAVAEWERLRASAHAH